MVAPKLVKTRSINLTYSPCVCEAPVPPQALHQQSCSNDTTTITHWSDTWVKNMKANWEEFGPFHKAPLGELHNLWQHKPAIVAGAGPSLRQNGHLLQNRNGIGLISCLHNFGFLEDQNAAPDFYVTLDSGEITIPEVYEGGTQPEEFYWERTKDRTLLAFVATDPRLIRKWRGKVVWFTAPIPDPAFKTELERMEFNQPVSSGGNVMGASFYIAKGYLGANPIAFVGADFSFSNYDTPKPQFHAWGSPYDRSIGQTVNMVDVYGNRCLTWPSYANFKAWFDYVFLTVPGVYFNCTEGGVMAAYPHGNLMQCRPIDLDTFYEMYRVSGHLENLCRNPKDKNVIMLF